MRRQPPKRRHPGIRRRPRPYSVSMTSDAAAVRRAALVYNPVKVDARRLRAQVAHAAERAGWGAPLFFETTPEDLGQGQARSALSQGADAVLVAGGDGTVRAVAEALAHTGVPLTIVPSGTGNLLARNLRLPLDDPDRVIGTAFTGDTVMIDVGFAELHRVDGARETHAYVVMGGIGLDAAMIANTRPSLKKSVGWVAYVDGAARSLVRAAPFRIVYQVGDQRLHSARVQSVLYANCGSLPAGLSLIPEASVVDATMDVVLFQPKAWWGWLFVWRRVAWDNSVLRRFRAGRRVLQLRTRDNAVRYMRGRTMEVAAAEPHPVQLDGDEFGEAVRIVSRIDAGALRVTVPTGHDLSRL